MTLSPELKSVFENIGLRASVWRQALRTAKNASPDPWNPPGGGGGVYRMAADAWPEGFVVLKPGPAGGADHAVTFECCAINGAGATLLGVNAEDMLDAEAGAALRADASRLPLTHWREAVRRGLPLRAQWSRSSANGVLSLELLTLPVDGWLVCTLRDVSAQMAAVRALERSLAQAREQTRQQDEFLANLSHELRTPLNALAGWAHVLNKPDVDPALVQRACEAISRNVQAQKAMIDDLMDLGQLAAGRIGLELKPHLLQDILQRSVDAVLLAAKGKLIQIEASPVPAGVTVKSDAARLEQVFRNLLSNAVKFTPMGGHVAVVTRLLGDRVVVEISDNGEGIAPDVLPHVFDRFHQISGATTRKHSGLGLGLAIAKGLLTMHGGAIALRSDGPGQGTKVRVWLPLHELQADRSAPAPLDADAEQDTALSWSRILLVENDEDCLDVVALTLREQGAVVRAFSEPQAALTAADHESFDLVISDLGMPGLDGFELMKRLRALNRCPPALALTGYAGTKVRSQALAAGFAEVIVKPVDPPRLVQIAAAALADGQGGQGGQGASGGARVGGDPWRTVSLPGNLV